MTYFISSKSATPYSITLKHTHFFVLAFFGIIFEMLWNGMLVNYSDCGYTYSCMQITTQRRNCHKLYSLLFHNKIKKQLSNSCFYLPQAY